ncbi:hypothetical protein GALL_154020 [mine drainage metagenome]|uniref:DUF4349 domain-containing protein n=1 Tax=mine drainage metagenome TaxID=410659 RepID=A0A1J5S364_9ZZZZ
MKKYILLLLMLIISTACGRHQSASSASDAASAVAPAPMSVRTKMSGAVRSFAAEQSLTEMSEPSGNAANSKKYIALRHHLQVEMPADQIQAAFDGAVKHCEALSCQMLSANYQRETPYSPPSASLSIRVPPRSVEVFLTGLAKSGEIMQHSREAEDKTNQVVDADARIKNLTELRDRLRAMLADKSAKFKDIIDVERELANTQSQLDSFMSMRKILAQETDLVAMNIDFVAKQGITEQGFFAPVVRALKDAGQVFMESVAAVITFVMSAIPWLLISFPIVLLLRKFWLRSKAK